MPDESHWFGIAANSLQHIYEFRLGTGRIIGVRAEGGMRITPEVRVVADAALYSHHLTVARRRPTGASGASRCVSTGPSVAIPDR